MVAGGLDAGVGVVQAPGFSVRLQASLKCSSPSLLLSFLVCKTKSGSWENPVS